MKNWFKKSAPYGIVAEVLLIAEFIFALFAAGSFILMVWGIFSPQMLDRLSIGPFQMEVSHDLPYKWYQLLLLFGMGFSMWKFTDTLLKFYRRVQDGVIFIDENVRALRVMGIASFLVVLFLDAFDYIMAKLMANELYHSGVSFGVTYHISWIYLFMALLIFVFATIFKKAVEAVKENNETI